MFKKVLIGSVATLVIGGYIFGKDVFSYLKTAGSQARDAVKSEVPVEFEIERARELVEELVPDIRHSMHVIAEQQVDIEHLNEVIASREEALNQQREVILALRTDLESGQEMYVYEGRSYSEEKVRRDLATRFSRYKTVQDTLARDRQILTAREKALQANQDKLDKMLVVRQDLEVQVEQLEARLKTVQAAETVSVLAIDDSQLNRAKTLIRELNKQLDVKEKLLDNDGRFTGLIPVATEPKIPSNLTKEIDDYFELRNEADLAEVGNSNL